MKIIHLFAIIMGICLLITSCGEKQTASKIYFISNTGNDQNDGSEKMPWKTLSKDNLLHIQAGDTIFFTGGETFDTSLVIDSLVSGTSEKPVVIASRGNIPAMIRSGNEYGCRITHCKNLKMENIHFSGNGRKEGNTREGVFLSGCRNMVLSDLDIQGYQKSGLRVHLSSDIMVKKIHAHNNGFAGILVSGKHNDKTVSRNIVIRDCTASNNPGDPTALNNHSGNGILVGNSTQVLIEYCTATNNGWDMPRTGNGPVGIWAYESDSVLIQRCIAYRNKTQKGAADGGGFDFDGGMTNSIIQYCLSYENEGAAFGLFQYESASPWYNNTVRYCISENDGSVSPAQAAIFVWNESDDPEKLKDCYVYNNTVYNEKGAAINYEAQSVHSNFYFCNNIFIVKDRFIHGTESKGVFEGNNWYSLSQMKQPLKGKNNQTFAPQFKNPGRTTLTDPHLLVFLEDYQLPEASLLKTSGIDLEKNFGWLMPDQDFNGRTILKNGIGSCQ